jgi:hypothetical protein
MLDAIEERLEAARSGGHPISLEELEELYTRGCAEVLELEADALRIKRRLAELRGALRHIRTAVEFLQDEHAAGDAAK